MTDEDGVPMARVVITHRTNMPLNRIRMSIDVAPPLASTHSSIIVNSLSELKADLFEKEFLLNGLPYSRNVILTEF